MSEIEGQMSLFEEVFEYTKTCDECGRVWSSYTPFPNDWECPAFREKVQRVLEG